MTFKQGIALVVAILIASVGTGIGKAYINHRAMQRVDKQIMDCIEGNGIPIIVDHSVRVCLHFSGAT